MLGSTSVDRFNAIARTAAIGLVVCCLLIDVARAGGTPASTDTPAKGEDGSAALGFAIESEMLTYRALESNSEAIACDIAAYLNGATANFSNPPAGAVCDVGTNTNAKVLIAPFDHASFDDFRLWRANMEILRSLRTRAAPYCSDSSVIVTGSRGSTATAAAPKISAALDLTPVGTAIDAAKTLLGLFSTVATNAPVVGTIQDQALMDGVARQLRTLNVNVLMPTSYMPFSLVAADVSQSPFLSSLDRVFQARSCLVTVAAKGDTAASDKANINRIVIDMDAYLSAAAPAPKSGSGSSSPPAKSTATAAAPSPAAETAISTPSLGNILAGDDLARKLGVDPATGLLPRKNSGWTHVLLLQALESGGTVANKSNVLGSKSRYSGGAVDTFALFTLDGDLECSGNVYDYGGSILAEDFQAELRRYKSDPASQFIFQRGSCRKPANP